MKICPFDPAAICANSSSAAPRVVTLTNPIQDKKKSKSSSDAVSVKSIRPYFRDLELRTSHVVCYSENLVSDDAFKPEEILGITPTMLLYVIANFRRKVDLFFTLSNKVTSASASGRNVRYQSPAVVRFFQRHFPLLPSLHLQTLLLSIYDEVLLL